MQLSLHKQGERWKASPPPLVPIPPCPTQALEARRETVGAVRLALALAADAQRLQRPVAHRKLAKEAEQVRTFRLLGRLIARSQGGAARVLVEGLLVHGWQGGLVVVEAVYGVLASAPPAASLHATANGSDEAASMSADAQPGVAQPEHDGEGSSPVGASPSPSGPDPSSAEGHGGPAGGGGEEEEELEVAAAARRADSILESARELPPQWLDVTAAVRFQVENGLLTFHPGAARAKGTSWAPLIVRTSAESHSIFTLCQRRLLGSMLGGRREEGGVDGLLRCRPRS